MLQHATIMLFCAIYSMQQYLLFLMCDRTFCFILCAVLYTVHIGYSIVCIHFIYLQSIFTYLFYIFIVYIHFMYL